MPPGPPSYGTFAHQISAGRAGAPSKRCGKPAALVRIVDVRPTWPREPEPPGDAPGPAVVRHVRPPDLRGPRPDHGSPGRTAEITILPAVADGMP